MTALHDLLPGPPFSVDSVPDLRGKSAVVTGANGGLGRQTAKVLASKGAHVLMTVRDPDKGEQAAKAIREDVPDAALKVIEMDLASQVSVQLAAEQILQSRFQLDILVNNAGVMATPEWQTQDGFEMQLGVNHLGHWTLTALLMPLLLRTSGARVVTVTSVAHHLGRAIDPEDPHLDKRYDPWLAYARSKLAGYHFGLGLQSEFERTGATAISLVAHPGLSDSGLQQKTLATGGAGWQASMWVWAARHLGTDVVDGAMPQLRAATDPNARGGEFYGPRFGTVGRPVRLPVLRRNEEAIRRLWAVSVQETGIALTE